MSDTATTTLTGIEYKLGRNGWVHPIIQFEPITFDDGVTLCRNELSHSLDIRKYKLGIGDQLVVQRTGISTVKIVKNITSSDTIETPKRCPFCNVYVKLKGEDLFCNYEWCKEAKLKRFMHFNKAMGIMIGDVSARKLVYQEDCNFPCATPIQLMDVKEIKLIALFGDFEGRKIYKSVQDAKHTTLDKFIWALDLTPHEYAKRMSEDCNGDVDLFIARCLSNYDWSHLKDFHQYRSNQINSAVKLRQNEIKKLRMKLFFKNEVGDNIFANKIFVVTGELNIFKNRNTLLDFIDNLGAYVIGSVTRDVDYLINNDKSIKSPKNRDAKLFDVPVITEQEFVDMCRGEGIDV